MQDETIALKTARISKLESQIQELQTELDGLLLEIKMDVSPDLFIETMTFPENLSETGFLNMTSSNTEKIKLFLSLFKGRPDVCAKRWRNKPGYSPYCRNDFRPGVCQKPRVRCSDCTVSDFAPLGPDQILEHLTGQHVLGLYPLTTADTCFLLAMDLDEANWQRDAQVIRSICREQNIPVSLERSRSGNGGHLWWFFESEVKASMARGFGLSILELAMAKSPDITFESFDRLFPSQDILPKDGFGNLIALPLQKEARASGNTVFLDDDLQIIEDQWSYLSSIQKIRPDQLEAFSPLELVRAMLYVAKNEAGILHRTALQFLLDDSR